MYIFLYWVNITKYVCFTDVGECGNHSLNNCSDYARCENTDGGFNCTCQDGYVGDGISCAGQSQKRFLFLQGFKFLVLVRSINGLKSLVSIHLPNIYLHKTHAPITVCIFNLQISIWTP